ncbi:N-acetylglucosamine-specific PTS transporter subunit IIBC [Brevundimonas sp.]|uniref:N-acetylglucosamine-specific PTS transporter subunit IIBC n=1 Tax=Brevundimonas sp. TaxID=1871086 RepID=UPI0028AB0BBA|nr:N-acetylglucosamine-specific PTS transporter subunit IIBC [Brevundimonas sp.]
MKIGLSSLQPLGRALMLPIAVLPVAGLLLRLGQPDLLDIAFISAAGQAVFANLGLLFAVGVAVGLARDNNGAAGLAGVVCFLISVEASKVLLAVPPEVVAGLTGDAADAASKAFKDQALARLGVPIGIVAGLIAGACYNRFSTFKLPDYLAFFAGRRFVPIVAGVAGLAVAAAVGLTFAGIDHAIDVFSRAVVGSGEFGLFVYGALNRLLIVTGLHHILNNVAWFIVGDYNGATGDLNRFFAGDPSAGVFMSGFFPVMMFGLPAACLAMYHAARPERRKEVGGMLFSLALTAFLTGVTEPIEFTFMFLAPVLYAIHAVLTGVSMVVMDLLGSRLGFTFSAGLFDYVLNYGRSTRPWVLLPVGLIYAGLYYGLFRVAISVLNLKTPGREDEPAVAVGTGEVAGGRAGGFVAALGGAGNLKTVAACTTRLRLEIRSREAIDEAALKRLGARGVIAPGPNQLQVVLGPIADAVADEIRHLIAVPGARTDAPASGQERRPTLSRPLMDALGGADNVAEVSARAGRLCVRLASSDPIDLAALRTLAPRGFVRTGDRSLQLLGF